MGNNERKVISVVVINESSVLARITSMFAARGYNIDSLTVAPIPESEMSHITIETSGNAKVMEQITKQLHKLIPVYKVIEHNEPVEKEMALVRFPITETPADIDALAKSYNGGIINVSEESIIVMVADDPIRVRHFIDAAKRYRPIEIRRSGVLAIER